MPKLDLDAIEQHQPHRLSAALRRADGESAVIAGSRRPPASTDFGVSHVMLKPGAFPAQRHWHEGEDEFVVMLAGEACWSRMRASTVLRPGDCAAFPKGDATAIIVVRIARTRTASSSSSAPARNEGGDYPDIDMSFTPDGHLCAQGWPSL